MSILSIAAFSPLGENQVAVIGGAGPDRRDARTADPVAAVVLHVESQRKHDLEDVGLGREPQSVSRLRQDQLVVVRIERSALLRLHPGPAEQLEADDVLIGAVHGLSGSLHGPQQADRSAHVDQPALGQVADDGLEVGAAIGVLGQDREPVTQASRRRQNAIDAACARRRSAWNGRPSRASSSAMAIIGVIPTPSGDEGVEGGVLEREALLGARHQKPVADPQLSWMKADPPGPPAPGGRRTARTTGRRGRRRGSTGGSCRPAHRRRCGHLVPTPAAGRCSRSGPAGPTPPPRPPMSSG